MITAPRRDEEDAAEIQHRDDHADRHQGWQAGGIVCALAALAAVRTE